MGHPTRPTRFDWKRRAEIAERGERAAIERLDETLILIESLPGQVPEKSLGERLKQALLDAKDRWNADSERIAKALPGVDFKLWLADGERLARYADREQALRIPHRVDRLRRRG